MCSIHFKGGKKKGNLDVPVIFPWTKAPRQSPKKRTVSCSDISQSSMSVNQLVDEVVNGHVSEDEGSDVYKLLTEVLHCDDDVQDAEVDGVIVSKQVTVTDAFTNTDPVSSVMWVFRMQLY